MSFLIIKCFSMKIINKIYPDSSSIIINILQTQKLYGCYNWPALNNLVEAM